MSPHAFQYEDCTIPQGMTVEDWREQRRLRRAAAIHAEPRWRRVLRRAL